MTGRRVLFAGAAAVCACALQGFAAGDWKAFPYGMLGDDLVRVAEVRGDQAQVVKADGGERQCRERDLKEVGDLPAAVETAVVKLERSVLDVRQACDMLRQQLAAEFDDGYLEMMAASLALREKVSGADASALHGVMQESRERRLQGLVSEGRGFDAERFTALVNRSKFVDAFIEAAADQVERQRAAHGREKTWIDAQAQVQSGGEQQATQKKSADLERAMQELAKRAEDLRAKKDSVSKASSDATELYDHFEQTYQKATQLLAAYAAVRERVSQGVEIGDADQRALATASDWAGEMLRPDTREATGKAPTALALLDRRRNPPPPKPPAAQPPPPAEKPPEQPKKNDGCFIATAVYGSYGHPDVLTLRQFRDGVLAPFEPGQRFIGWYYRNGPVAAEWLNARPAFKPFVRAPLCAVVWGLRHPALLLAGCVALLALLRWRRARRGISGLNKEVDHASAV